MATSKTVKTVVKDPVKQDYEVLIPGWVAGAYRKKGDVIALTEAAAKYEVLGGKLEPKKSTRRSRSKGDEAKAADAPAKD